MGKASGKGGAPLTSLRRNRRQPLPLLGSCQGPDKPVRDCSRQRAWRRLQGRRSGTLFDDHGTPASKGGPCSVDPWLSAWVSVLARLTAGSCRRPGKTRHPPCSQTQALEDSDPGSWGSSRTSLAVTSNARGKLRRRLTLRWSGRPAMTGDAPANRLRQRRRQLHRAVMRNRGPEPPVSHASASLQL